MIPAENIMRVLPDARPPSREELAEYLDGCADACLTHLARRPLTLVRSVDGTTFFHKGPLPPIPSDVRQLEITKGDGSRGTRVWVDDRPGLLALLDLDVVEIHPWSATVDDIERPDRLVFDLDPDVGVPWREVTRAALGLRDFLATRNLKTWPKTTGGKGLHVMVPLVPDHSWSDMRTIARRLAGDFAATAPDRYTASSGPGARLGGKIFIDYLRNGRGQSAIGAMSPRARRGGLVSMPLSWSEVQEGVTPEKFTLPAVVERCRAALVAPAT